MRDVSVTSPHSRNGYAMKPIDALTEEAVLAMVERVGPLLPGRSCEAASAFKDGDTSSLLSIGCHGMAAWSFANSAT